MATPSEQLDRIKDKERIEKAKTKAFWMRVTEGAAMIGTAAATQALESWKPEMFAGGFGPKNKLSLDGIAMSLGLAGILFAQGPLQDVASGMFNAGSVPITKRLVARAFTP